MATSANTTQILRALRGGSLAAAEELQAVIYEEMRRIARAQMRGERKNHTLHPTALVNEAYLRLVESETDWESRAHFFGAAVRAMRQILVDHARRRGRIKRGGRRERVPLEEIEPTAEDAEEMLALDDALVRLAASDARKARVVELKFFAGLTMEQIAELLGVSPRSVKRDWNFARAWLYREMFADEKPGAANPD